MAKKIFVKSFLVCTLLMFLLACNSGLPKNEAVERKESPSYGTIYISVDESFKPVIEEQLKVYKSSFPETNIIATYKSEVACFKDLQNDSTRLIVTARDLRKPELKFYKEKLQYYPMQSIMAYDAVAVITNHSSEDSVYSLAQLTSLLTGDKAGVTVMMDGKNATSTVRFVQDKLLKGKAFGKNVVASTSSQAVIDFVSNHANAIGFVGLSWVGDNYDVKQLEQLKKIKIALLECQLCDKGTFAKPSQATITYGQYPLARPLYCIVKENSTGLGTGFYNFMSLERGQLIFRRAFLAPAKIGFQKRTTKI